MTYHIFLDTNIIQHSQNKILSTINLHIKNKKFYKRNKCYLTSNVINELTSHQVNIEKGLGEIVKIIKLDNSIDYIINLIKDLYEYICELIRYYSKIVNLEIQKDYKEVISNGSRFIFESLKKNSNEELPFNDSTVKDIFGFNKNDLITKLNKINIDYLNERTEENYYKAFATILENTSFGLKEYHGFRYKDYIRLIANFTYDYKNYEKKGKKQKKKIGKDSIIFIELFF